MPITDDELVEGMVRAYADAPRTRDMVPHGMRAALAYAKPIIEREARDKALDQAVQAVANAWQNTAYFHAEAMIAACNAILALKNASHD